MRQFIQARKRVDVSPGESVRILRELQGLTQTQLSELCGIPQTTLSGIETGRINLGLPPLSTQHDFARRVLAIDELRKDQHASRAELDSLFTSLQHRAFRGEL